MPGPDVYYVDSKQGGTLFTDSVVECPFKAKFVSIRWKSGVGALWFSFDGVNVHGYLAIDTSPEGAYPNEVTFECEGVDTVYLKNAAVYGSVRFWR